MQSHKWIRKIDVGDRLWLRYLAEREKIRLELPLLVYSNLLFALWVF